jgi:uncharacterized protein (TIGR02466 family)
MSTQEYEFTAEHKAYVTNTDFHSQSKDWPSTNYSTTNTYLLDEPMFADLKEKLTFHLNQFTKEYMKFDNEFYITNSWLNYNPKGAMHLPHFHGNSLYSGVYYVNTPEGSGEVGFSSSVPPQIVIHPKEFNMHNTYFWKFPVKSKDIMIFPSNVRHQVPENPAEEARISIAFNSWCRGSVGDKLLSSYLEFK